MQWVETTGKTIDEAKGLALDQLGVAEEDTEFEVLEEPRSGLFGRIKGEARVRARVRPTAVRPKLERRDRKKAREGGGDSHAAQEGQATRETREPRTSRGPREQDRPVAAQGGSDTVPATSGSANGKQRKAQTRREPVSTMQREDSDVSAQQVGDEAKKFLTELIDAFGLEGSVELREDGDDLELAVSGADLGLMVGPRGNTLLAVQDLTRVASQRRLGDHDTRLRVDIGGYRERRREALSRFALDVATQVTAAGEARALEPMPSADRKVIHDVLTDHATVVTRSEGDDPNRRVVIAPANA